MGMNDQIPAGRSGPPSRRSAPPARPIWRSAPCGCRLLGSTRLRAELGGAAKEGAGGRLQTAPATEGVEKSPLELWKAEWTKHEELESQVQEE